MEAHLVSRETRRVLGGLTPQQIKRLSPEVRSARAAYIADSGYQLDRLFHSGVTELRADHPDKDQWDGTRKDGAESLDRLSELGYQLGADGALYEPEADD